VKSAAAVERDDFAIRPRETSTGELFEDAARFAETLPGDHPLLVEGGTEERVWADPYGIGQVLRNLLSNAAKYSPEGAPIELRAVPANSPGRVRIEVVDRGYGEDPDDAQRIFEKFGRGRSGRQAYGLGLYLSRRIVKAHGGDLTFDPRGPGAARFSVSSWKSCKVNRVLLVEDHAAFREPLAFMFAGLPGGAYLLEVHLARGPGQPRVSGLLHGVAVHPIGVQVVAE
jgi:K+-sensing histidine kinase KdpD